jgi:hypothetical protein
MIRSTKFAIVGSGVIREIDTIEYGGVLWLVPEWFEYPSEGKAMPVRMIGGPGLEFQPLAGGYILASPIPEALLRGEIPKGEEQRYLVVESPGIEFSLQSVRPSRPH